MLDGKSASYGEAVKEPIAGNGAMITQKDWVSKLGEAEPLRLNHRQRAQVHPGTSYLEVRGPPGLDVYLHLFLMTNVFHSCWRFYLRLTVRQRLRTVSRRRTVPRGSGADVPFVIIATIVVVFVNVHLP